VAVGTVRDQVEDTVWEALLKWTGGTCPDINPTIVLQVGHENEKPQVLILESEGAQDASQSTRIDSNVAKPSKFEWWNVAKPVPSELEEDVLLDRFWCNFRFVGPYNRPYVTLAVSRHIDSPCFPMTFFLDTGSPANFIKRSVFDRIALDERPSTGQKVLYIVVNHISLINLVRLYTTAILM